jgi:DNA oxidative demethylase
MSVLHAFTKTVVSQVSRVPPAHYSGCTGLIYHPQRLSKEDQRALITAVGGIVAAAPLFCPVMPRTGKPFSVAMTNCGPLGWVSDKSGYRYQPTHPVNGKPWPPMPPQLLALWREVANTEALPEACLINIYPPGARMGSHQDRDEADFNAPVVSISLGDSATFHVGGLKRSDPKSRFVLQSGDVVVLGGEARLAFHGIDRLHPGTSQLDRSVISSDCSRINLTLRRVSATRI